MKSVNNARTIKEIQQDFGNNCGFGSEIIWDLLSSTQSQHLKNKIKNLIPDQEKGQKTVEETREIIFNQVWAQRTYTNGNSLSSIIYVLVTKETDMKIAQESTEFSCHSVFRTRKCNDDSDSLECCMIFIDEVGRVYQNWKSYLNNNVLPEGTMVFPRNGIYTLDTLNEVQMEMQATPASSIAKKTLNATDTTSTVAGLGAAIIPISAIFMPVAVPFIGAAAIVGLTVAGYKTIRSGSNLIDRRQHDQSIGLNDRQARSNWISFAAGFIGLGASGATTAMTTVAKSGREVSEVTEVVVNGMNISSKLLSGTGVANGVLDILLEYQDNEDISMLDIAQLSASLFLFTHSVSNFQLASEIINHTRNKTLQSHQKILSNWQRRMFDKMSKETIRIRGDARGRMDIIRNVNDIPPKQYLNDLYIINKIPNLQTLLALPAVGAPGEGVELDNEVPVETGILLNSSDDILESVTQAIPSSYQEVNTGNSFSPRQLQTSRIIFESRTNMAESNNNFAPGVHALRFSTILLTNDVEIPLSEFGTRIFENIVNAESFENIITTLGDNFVEDAFRYLINLADRFIYKLQEEMQNVLPVFISTELILYRILMYYVDNYVDKSLEFLREHEMDVLKALQEHFMSLNPNNFDGLKTKCKNCSGYFSTCAI